MELEDQLKPDVNPIVAAVLSLIIPGVGHFYAGLQKRGAYWLGGIIVYVVVASLGSVILIGLLLFLVQPLVHIGSAIDAYMQTS